MSRKGNVRKQKLLVVLRHLFEYQDDPDISTSFMLFEKLSYLFFSKGKSS